MAILVKAVDRFSVLPIKMPMVFFNELEINPKIYRETQKKTKDPEEQKQSWERTHGVGRWQRRTASLSCSQHTKEASRATTTMKKTWKLQNWPTSQGDEGNNSLGSINWQSHNQSGLQPFSHCSWRKRDGTGRGYACRNSAHMAQEICCGSMSAHWIGL